MNAPDPHSRSLAQRLYFQIKNSTAVFSCGKYGPEAKRLSDGFRTAVRQHQQPGRQVLDDGFVEKRPALQGPDTEAGFIDRVLQGVDLLFRVPATKIPGGGRIGNRMGAEHVQVRRVLPSILDVFQGGAAAEQVVSDVEQVIGLPIGQVMDQYGNGIEGVIQAGTKGDLMNQGESAVGNGLGFLGDFVTDGNLRQLRRSENRLGSIRAKFDFLLVLFNEFVYFVFI